MVADTGLVRHDDDLDNNFVPKKCPKSVQDTSDRANYSVYSGRF